MILLIQNIKYHYCCIFERFSIIYFFYYIIYLIIIDSQIKSLLSLSKYIDIKEEYHSNQ